MKRFRVDDRVRLVEKSVFSQPDLEIGHTGIVVRSWLEGDDPFVHVRWDRDGKCSPAWYAGRFELVPQSLDPLNIRIQSYCTEALKDA